MAEITFKIEDTELDKVSDLIAEVAEKEDVILDLRAGTPKQENEGKLDFTQRVLSSVLSQYIKTLSRAKAHLDYRIQMEAIPRPEAKITTEMVQVLSMKT